MANVAETLLRIQGEKSPFIGMLEGFAGGFSSAQDKALERAKLIVEMNNQREDRARALEMHQRVMKMMPIEMEKQTQNALASTAPPNPVLPSQKFHVGITSDTKTGLYGAKIESVNPLDEELKRARIGYYRRPDASQPKAPAGFRWTANGELEAIPGGPADIKQTEKETKSAGLVNASVNQADRIIGKIDQALGIVGMNSAGVGAHLRAIPGTQARDLASNLQTIKANLGFAELQAMRQASPTGGALGQVAVQELEALQSTIASLDQEQSPTQLKQSLNQVRKHYEGWKQAVTQAGGSSTARTLSAPSPGRVRMKDPSGRLYEMDATEMPDALNAGWSRE